MLDWLCAWLLETTHKRAQQLKGSGQNSFHTRNDMQVFHAQTLTILYGQRTIFFIFYKHLLELNDSAEKRVLQRLLSLYGGNIVLKQIGLLYEVRCINIQHHRPFHITLCFRHSGWLHLGQSIAAILQKWHHRIVRRFEK